MLKFFVVTGFGLTLLNGWIIWWLWRALDHTGWLRPVLCLTVAVLGASFPLLYKLGGDLAAEVWLLRAGSFWLGISFYVFILVLILDIWGLTSRLWAGPPVAPRWGATLLVMGIPLIIGCASWFNAANPIVRQYDLTIRTNDPVPQRYAQSPLVLGVLADMHLGRIITAPRLVRAMDLLAPYKPDAVLYVGDIIDDHILVDVEGMAAALARVQPRLGHWVVPGNHEYISGPIKHSLDILRRSGMQVLRDQWHILDNAIVLVGRDDRSRRAFEGTPRKSLPEILADVPQAHRNLPIFVMDHQPHNLDEARTAGAVLELSGHTHYGQLWPFHWVVESMYENPMGLLIKQGLHSVVTAGAGTWGGPMRNTSRAEVLIVNVHFAPTAQ
ncbi:MAG: metallophosphoesterase [Desulfovibrio sp.]|nr:metallophosphoesterase [Desulfovibrio sp.]